MHPRQFQKVNNNNVDIIDNNNIINNNNNNNDLTNNNNNEPVNDVKIVAVIALSDDVISGVDSSFKHRVQNFA